MNSDIPAHQEEAECLAIGAALEAVDRLRSVPIAAADPKPVHWRPMVLVQRQWAGNALVFATPQEALDNARELMGRWFAVTDYRADPTDAPVNYRWTADGLERLPNQ